MEKDKTKIIVSDWPTYEVMSMGLSDQLKTLYSLMLKIRSFKESIKLWVRSEKTDYILNAQNDNEMIVKAQDFDSERKLSDILSDIQKFQFYMDRHASSHRRSPFLSGYHYPPQLYGERSFFEYIQKHRHGKMGSGGYVLIAEINEQNKRNFFVNKKKNTTECEVLLYNCLYEKDLICALKTNSKYGFCKVLSTKKELVDDACGKTKWPPRRITSILGELRYKVCSNKVFQ
jgi:hypothetical protein